MLANDGFRVYSYDECFYSINSQHCTWCKFRKCFFLMLVLNACRHKADSKHRFQVYCARAAAGARVSHLHLCHLLRCVCFMSWRYTLLYIKTSFLVLPWARHLCHVSGALGLCRGLVFWLYKAFCSISRRWEVFFAGTEKQGACWKVRRWVDRVGAVR